MSEDLDIDSLPLSAEALEAMQSAPRKPGKAKKAAATGSVPLIQKDSTLVEEQVYTGPLAGQVITLDNGLVIEHS